MNTELENLNQRSRRWDFFDPENPLRTVILGVDVDSDSMTDIMEMIAFINNFDDENEEVKKDYERKPIKLIINSYGGSVYDGFALIGYIENSKTPIHTYSYGSSMSMALLIFVAGHYRVASRFTTIMYHECLDQLVYDKLTTLKENIEETKRIMVQYDEYLVSRTKLRKKQLENTKAKKLDWYIKPVDALRYGIADEII